MRISIHGSDRGSAVLLSLTLILIFSLLFLSFSSYLVSLNKNIHKYRDQVLSEIKETNQEIISRYDLH